MIHLILHLLLQGIHVAHVLIDGPVDMPLVRKYLPNKSAEELLNPDEVLPHTLNYFVVHNTIKSLPCIMLLFLFKYCYIRLQISTGICILNINLHGLMNWKLDLSAKACISSNKGFHSNIMIIVFVL